MQRTNTSELEHRAAQAGVARRHLWPLWCRIWRRLGVDLPSPVLQSYPHHLLYGGVVVLVTMSLAFTLVSLLWLRRPPALELLVAAAMLAILVPSANWLRYRSIRRRLGLAPRP